MRISFVPVTPGLVMAGHCFRIISRGLGNTNTTLFLREWCFFMQGKVEICGVNTAALPVLKSAETRELLQQASTGDKHARAKQISGNLRLVLSVIQKFAGRGESMDDLFQVGVIGLIKAVDCFDLSQGVQFSTYGVPNTEVEIPCFSRSHT